MATDVRVRPIHYVPDWYRKPDLESQVFLLFSVLACMLAFFSNIVLAEVVAWAWLLLLHTYGFITDNDRPRSMPQLMEIRGFRYLNWFMQGMHLFFMGVSTTGVVVKLTEMF